MESASSMEEVTNRTLQKIGRNVVNFQKMEAMLKFILAFSDLSGPLSAMGDQVAGRVALFAKMPMGRLVEDGAAGLYASARNRAPVSTAEIGASISFSLDGGKDEAQMWKSAMMAVVSERNHLIHQMLAGVDLRSVEACEWLSTQLDLQRERTIPVYEHLASLVQTIRTGYKEVVESMERALTAEFDNEPNNAA